MSEVGAKKALSELGAIAETAMSKALLYLLMAIAYLDAAIRSLRTHDRRGAFREIMICVGYLGIALSTSELVI